MIMRECHCLGIKASSSELLFFNTNVGSKSAKCSSKLKETIKYNKTAFAFGPKCDWCCYSNVTFGYETLEKRHLKFFLLEPNKKVSVHVQY